MLPEELANMSGVSFYLLLIIWLILISWELVWKGIALWKSGRNNQLPWFIAILIVNSIGILPIIYLLFFQKNKNIVSKKGKHK